MKIRTTAVLLSLFLTASTALSDIVVTKDGSQIQGKIKGIEGGKMTIATNFAGELEISKDQIDTFSTDGEVFVSFEDGSSHKGQVNGLEGGSLGISTSRGEIQSPITAVTDSWLVGAKSPTERALARNWSYEAAFDLTGKNGNSESLGLGSNFRARLTGPQDTLEFYAALNFEETDELRSADDARAGVDYSNKISQKTSWYIRSEFGRDQIEALKLYLNTAAGFGYSPVSNEQRVLTYRGGISYRFESYNGVADDLSSAGLDLSLFHRETFGWGQLVNRITYNPVFEDFGNFRLVQDSALELPLATEGWSLRIGIANEYNSEPQPGKEELDTTYYTRLLLKWK